MQHAVIHFIDNEYFMSAQDIWEIAGGVDLINGRVSLNFILLNK